MEKGVMTSVKVLYGVGDKRAAAFMKLGISNVYDLLFHFPRAYENRGNVKNVCDVSDGELCSLILCVAASPKNTLIRRGMMLTKLSATDDTGKCNITFFNQPYVREVLREGGYFRFYGRVKRNGKNVEMSSPVFEPVLPGKVLRPLIPVYPLSSPLTQKFVSDSIVSALEFAFSKQSGEMLSENLSDEIRRKYSLAEFSFALRGIHAPKDFETAEKSRRRLVFDELYFFALYILRNGKNKKTPTRFIFGRPEREEFLKNFSYPPTLAQVRTFDEIDSDVTSGNRMHRLIIGDVGSGKTLCAEYAVYAAVKNGAQAAVMAPTEILARQHYLEFKKLFDSLGYSTELLVGSLKASEKKRVRLSLENGNADIVIGTHSLIEENVKFKNLGLCIVDEQHRFGAAQRAALSAKSEDCHVLSMSATPIPRTLAFVLYGDYDLSNLDIMPPGRKCVDTFVVDESYRKRLYAFIRKNVEEGGQVYIVCPSVEERETLVGESGEKVDIDELFSFESEKREKPKLFAAVDYAKELSENVFPDISVGFVHGKMKSAEKERVMSDFCAGNIKILVSTTVIEVGVNVPSATLMIVENADMFGLAALHQLRGRVGRGDKKSYCVLVSSSDSEKSKERLYALKENHDGYKIAEIDLSMRGPGDFVSERTGSVRQSGDIEFKLASTADTEMLYNAFDAAKNTIENDPDLSLPENKMTRFRLSYETEKCDKTK